MISGLTRKIPTPIPFTTPTMSPTSRPSATAWAVPVLARSAIT
jgi:hypothetical protein